MTKVAQSLPEAPSVGTDTSVSDESESPPSILLIAVMGVTGSGKSNFLRLLTGRDDEDGPQVGHSLGSCKSTLDFMDDERTLIANRHAKDGSLRVPHPGPAVCLF